MAKVSLKSKSEHNDSLEFKQRCEADACGFDRL